MANNKEFQTALLSSLSNLFNVYVGATNALHALLTVKNEQLRLLQYLMDENNVSKSKLKKIQRKIKYVKFVTNLIFLFFL